MSTKTPKINVFINRFGPLIKQVEIKKILSSEVQDQYISVISAILEGFFELPIKCLNEEILKRYIEVTENLHTNFASAEERIFLRIIKPLASAKRNYCLGDYIATIATCGIASEMLTLFIWEANNIILKGKVLSKGNQEVIFGHTFGRISQERKLKILKTFEFISPEEFIKFNVVRNIRNNYMHAWNVDTENTERQDALKVFKNTFELYKRFLEPRLEVNNGKQGLKISEQFIRFLAKKQKNT